MLTILVTGGCGYIGSHTIVALVQKGYNVISIDNLSRGSIKALAGIKAITGVDIINYNLDLCNYAAIKPIFEAHKIDGIIHFAAFKTVPESVAEPLLYYKNNNESLLNILQLVKECSIKNFVFSSSCSVYGAVAQLPVTEVSVLNNPECPYAATKQMGEQMIKDLSIAHKQLNSAILRYFNPVGAHPSNIIGERVKGYANNLVPAITQAAAGLKESLEVYGYEHNTRDGSCVRDFIHVCDVASAHVNALEYLQNATAKVDAEIFNLGYGDGVTVLEAIYSFEKVNNLKLNYTLHKERAGDVPAIYANCDKAKTILNWHCQYTLDDMMRTAWAWQQQLLTEIN